MSVLLPAQPALQPAARLIDGKAIAAALRADVAAKVTAAGFTPGLAVVLVGDDPASTVYVRTKDRAAREAGIDATTIRLPPDTSQADLLAAIQALNDDPAIDGILVQLPLPRGINPQAVIQAIDPAKDVDGFHPTNVGHLADGRPTLVPCTPLGVMKLLRAIGVEIAGARAVVLGRSAIVGRPMARLLLAAERDHHRSPFPHARLARGVPPGGHPDRRRSASPRWSRATGSSPAPR